MSQKAKRITLCNEDQALVGGVCGGIAEYLQLDPSLVRIVWAIASLCFGLPVMVYFLCWWIIPNKEDQP